MNVNKPNMVFNENNRELWYFSVSRPIKQHLLHYTLKSIAKQNTLRSNTK